MMFSMIRPKPISMDMSSQMPCQAALLYLAVHQAIVSAMEDLQHCLGLQASCSVNHSVLLSSKDCHVSKAAERLVHPLPEQHM